MIFVMTDDLRMSLQGNVDFVTAKPL